MDRNLERAVRKLEEVRQILAGEYPSQDHRPVWELLEDAAFSVCEAGKDDDGLKDLFTWEE